MDGQANRDRIIAALGDMASDSGTQGASPGSFAFTESDIRKVITNWLDIAQSYQNSRNKANYVTVVEGPGLDFASESFATSAVASGVSLLVHLEYGKKYCLDQAQLAQNALDDYLGVEHTNVRELFKARPDQETEV